ncbi:MAG TPA: class I SAM-dependent methyltransferase [Solirubrobacterales bacterium]
MPAPPLTPLAAAVLHVGSPERILQVECGDGDGALFLAREFPAARVRGVDRSEQAARHATARIGLDPEGRIAFKEGTPRSLPFPDDHFDLVAVVDAKPSPRETARVLRPGGFLVLADSARSRAPGDASRRLLDWRLRRRGLESVWSAEAGDGSFSVACLGAPGRSPAAD